MSNSVKDRFPRPLSAKYRQDFAYPTVKDRIPVILTKVIDHICRLKTDSIFLEKYGEAAKEDLKAICGSLSQLKNEIQTDKPIASLSDDRPDTEMWNKCLTHELGTGAGQTKVSWFSSSWLYVECYFYRRVMEAFHLSSSMRKFDPFGAQKCHAFTSSLQAISKFGDHLDSVVKALESSIAGDLEETFKQYLQVSLWGNKCDLSISAGSENSQSANPLSQLSSLKSNMLCDHSGAVWQKLNNARLSSGGGACVHIVLDNAGFELFTDLCLAELLVSGGLARSVVFHGKTLPWFVSDVMRQDLDWTLGELEKSESTSLRTLGNCWRGRLSSGSWTYTDNDFWCLPYDFAQMESITPSLYSQLATADFVFLKGDLNYRKLSGDLKWDPQVSLDMALRGFCPAPLCTLRTLKSDIVVGLEAGVAEATEAKDEKWMISGNWAVIQMVDKSS